VRIQSLRVKLTNHLPLDRFAIHQRLSYDIKNRRTAAVADFL